MPSTVAAGGRTNRATAPAVDQVARDRGGPLAIPSTLIDHDALDTQGRRPDKRNGGPELPAIMAAVSRLDKRLGPSWRFFLG